ncbi:MAG: hypothetical protein KBA97_10920 [Methanothrix sp.]|nr:hypothetical protein [Methanothrix sp.]
MDRYLLALAGREDRSRRGPEKAAALGWELSRPVAESSSRCREKIR